MDRGAHLTAEPATSAGNQRYRYTPDDEQRWVAEDVKRGQFSDRPTGDRAAFARDRARVLHSYAFRRLADKTQVVSPGQDDFPRTRLTHSLEVAQIGREIGAALGCDPEITDTAGLAHDLGHPPFGHNGEQALDEVCSGIGGFEGNAQTLRILTRLEAKVAAADGRPVGLNLTRASLDAVSKYPWPNNGAGGKFGVYREDLPAFRWIRAGRADGGRCLEAQVMDWADDVAYSVHDVEDGVHSGHVELDRLDDQAGSELCRLAAEQYSARSAVELEPALERLLRLRALSDLAGYDGSFRAQIASKRATSELTGRFVGAAVQATRGKHGTEPLGRYACDLVVPDEVADECALLKAIALRYVMRREGITSVLLQQRATLTELVEALLASDGRELSRVMREQWDTAADDSARLRVVVDQVAQLTDSSARAWHRRLCKTSST